MGMGCAVQEEIIGMKTSKTYQFGDTAALVMVNSIPSKAG
jgi:hypothetical protein